MRLVGMSIEHIKEYIALCQKGLESVEQRKAMLVAQREEVIAKIRAFNQALEHLDYKISLYQEASKDQKDFLNPLNFKISSQCCKK